MKFRDAHVHDLPSIVEIYNSTIESRMVTADTEPVAQESKLRWFHSHESDKRPLWVLEDEGNHIHGWVSFQSFYGRPAYDATAEISIYLHPAARGKGLGNSMLQYSLNNCDRLHIKTLLGFIFEHNTPSLHLFRNFGFLDWGLLPNIALLDGIERSLVILGKRVIR